MAGDTNGLADWFVHDRVTGITTRVNVDSAGVEADGSSADADLSGDGRFISFESLATNLVAGDTNGLSDVFVHDPGEADQDGQLDPFDNCPSVTNAGQDDADGDNVGDVCDNCPAIPNAGQIDGDNDAVGDTCDACPGTLTGEAADANGCSWAQADADMDGVCNPGNSTPVWCTGSDDCPGTPPGESVDTNGCSLGGNNTPVGIDTTVTVTNVIDLTFSSVSTEGATTVSVSTSGSPPPPAFKILGLAAQPVYYDISTTATFSGSITVCIEYDETQVAGPESQLKLMHQVAGFVDVSTSIDTVSNVICGTSTTLSEFAVTEPLDGDADGVEIPLDNCPTLANINQVNTDVALKAAIATVNSVALPSDGDGDACDDDDDNDSFNGVTVLTQVPGAAATACPGGSVPVWADCVEFYFGTDLDDNCNGAPGTGTDAFPPDVDKTDSVDIGDVFALFPAWLTSSARHDLDASGQVNVGDIFSLFPWWLISCS